jgi:hypothetical protein
LSAAQEPSQRPVQLRGSRLARALLRLAGRRGLRHHLAAPVRPPERQAPQ